MTIRPVAGASPRRSWPELAVLCAVLALAGCGGGGSGAAAPAPAASPPPATGTGTVAAPLPAPTAPPAPATFSAPLRITAPGSYSGAWGSTDPAQPAVSIATTAPVVLQNCYLRGKGDLVRATVGDAHVTIRNCTGIGLDPLVAGATRGSFFVADRIGSLTAENNYWSATSFGVHLTGGSGWTPDGAIVIRFNQAVNLDGAPSDGQGGRDLSHLAEGEDNGNHVVLLANLSGIPSAEIAWNEVIDAPGISSVGDLINIYATSGTAAAPLAIHDNYLQGGFAAHPTAATGYTACGITMDGGASDSATTATAYVQIRDNQVVAQAHCGIGLAAGHDVAAFNNRAVASGQLVDGTWVGAADGIGLYVWPAYAQPATVYFNNVAHDNAVAWQFEALDPANGAARIAPAVRNDYYLPGCPRSGAVLCNNDASLAGPISTTTEAAEGAAWRAKVAAQAVVIGPPR